MTMNKNAKHKNAQSEKLAAFPIARWRFYGVTTALCALACTLVWHVAGLQVLTGEDKGFEFLQGQGQARTLRTESISAYRGVITDRNGEPLAVSSPVQTLWANPQLFDMARIEELANSLAVDSDELANKFARYKSKEFVYLQRQLPPHKAEAVLALKIPGVFSQKEYRRFYPAAEVATHVLGFTDMNDAGQEGLELAYDEWLRGTAGSRQIVKDLKGRTIKEVQLLRAAQPGNDLALSIDLRVQYLAHRELKAAVQQRGAKSGSIVVLDVATGEVLAMANQPSYNPNDRSRIQSSAVRNRAITDQFEPGSTMKPLTVMVALESGRYTPGTMVDTSPGYIRVGRKTLLDPVNYGEIDVTKILTKSSQVGVTKLALDLDPQDIRDMFFRVGLGQGVGTGFPGEGVGVLPNKTRWQPIERANFAFGHGLSLTALQLAQAYAVIASGGVKRPVSLVKQSTVPVEEVVIESKVAAQVLDMLKTVTQRGGTATRAHIAAYPVAGKTGTVHKVGSEGYADDHYISLFAGIAPANDPRIAAVIVINDPSDGKYFGGEVAAPVFAKVAEGALRLLQVPPKVEPKKSIAQQSNDKKVIDKKIRPVAEILKAQEKNSQERSVS